MFGSRAILVVLATVAAAVALNYPFRAAKMFQENQGIDFRRHNYFYAAMYKDGADPYDSAAIQEYHRRLGVAPECRAGYSPVFLQALAPFAACSLRTATGLWLALEHLCLALALFLLWRLRSRGDPWPMAVALLVLALGFDALLYDVRSAQSTMLVLLLVTVAACFWDRPRCPWAGLALALAALVKIELVFLLPYALWRRNWGALGWAALSLLVLVGLSVAVAGTDVWRHYFAVVWDFVQGKPVLLYGQDPSAGTPTAVMGSAIWDVSASAWLSRWVIPSAATSPLVDAPGALIYLRWLPAAGISAWLLKATWRPAPGAGAIDAALGVTAIALCTPKLMFYGYVYLLLPLGLVLRDALEEQPRLGRWALPAVYLLCFQNTTALRAGLGQALGRPALLSLVPPPEVMGVVLLFVLLLRLRDARCSA